MRVSYTLNVMIWHCFYEEREDNRFIGMKRVCNVSNVYEIVWNLHWGVVVSSFVFFLIRYGCLYACLALRSPFLSSHLSSSPDSSAGRPRWLSLFVWEYQPASQPCFSLKNQSAVLLANQISPSKQATVIKLPEVACLHAYRITHRSQHVCMHTISCIFQLYPSKGRLGGSDESLMSFKNFLWPKKACLVQIDFSCERDYIFLWDTPGSELLLTPNIDTYE
jgi:hypothetical protein